MCMLTGNREYCVLDSCKIFGVCDHAVNMCMVNIKSLLLFSTAVL